MKLKPEQKRAWIEVNLDAIEQNFLILKETLENKTKVCCVIKANAYGHGAIELAKVYEELGADFLAVSNIEEALQLRKELITLPILVLGYTDPLSVLELVDKNISQCVFSLDYAKQLSFAAINNGVKIKVHFKLDTGMGRIGFLPDECEDLLTACCLPGFIREGIFTHFSMADEGEKGKLYTNNQFCVFQKILAFLKKQGIDFDIRHCANSAATLVYPATRMDMVRVGIALYGLLQFEGIERKGFVRTLKLKTIVSHIKYVKKGDCISYGGTYKASEKRRIATLPIGYADGVWRSNVIHGGEVEICGKRVPFVGKICMDQCMVDVTDLPFLSIGDDVTVYGGDVPLEEVADKNGTITYEILTNLGKRLPFVYVRKGKVEKIIDNLL